MAPPHAQLQPGTNRLLDLLPRVERKCLAPHLEPVPLEFDQVLVEVDQPLRHVYFPQSGVMSHLVTMEGGGITEAGLIGFDGFVGVCVLLAGPQTPSTDRVIVQVPGEGQRMETATFHRLLQECPTLHAVLQKYTLAMLNQIARTSACNGTHSINERCARWLLLIHDRMPGDTFPLTQQYLAYMLSVRRPGISVAASALKQAGLIDYTRGVITILDRAGLEAASCEDYQRSQDEYTRLLG